jgi:hypothetical protein
MRFPQSIPTIGAAILSLPAAMLVLGGKTAAQSALGFSESRDHPAIQYSSRVTSDPIAMLARRLDAGDVRLTYDRDNGYLGSLLAALRVPKESQVAVFSQTSFQAELISPRNPRALFFNDRVFVGWVRGADTLELAAHDAEQGTIFYTLEQRETNRPALKRDDNTCLTCHLTWDTLGVPGLMTFSVFSIPQDKYSYASGAISDHRTPWEDRWGGWYVTGRPGTVRHLGNAEIPQLVSKAGGRVREHASLNGLFDLRGFPTPHSDVVALMVLEHQTRMANLITRLGWQARVAMHPTPSQRGAAEPGVRAKPTAVRDAAHELVDYMLFVDEFPLAGQVRGSSGFAEMFSAGGPQDPRGRSLRQLDLAERLMKYRCSYMIYSEAFDRLPGVAKQLVYERLWQILSGQEQKPPYTRLGVEERRTIVEILRETKPGLPSYFGSVAR